MAFPCTIDEVKSILSSYGVSVTTDDERTGEGDPTFQDEAGERAYQRVLQYVHKQYDPSENTDNDWLKWCHATLWAVQLRRRLGDDLPPGLEADYTEFIESLEQIKEGELQIPLATPRKSRYGMAMSNVEFDPRYYQNKIRVNDRISTGDNNSDVPRDHVWYAPVQE